MTSPVSAIEAIEKAMEGVTHPDAPEWIAVAQDGDGPNGGFWTCAAATTESPRYIRADICAAIARQAEALQQEVDSLKQTRQHSREASAALHDAFMEERKRVEALERENAELREALKPFAECAPEWESEPDSLHVFLEWNDEKAPVPSLPVADFRHARALLGVSNAE